MGLSCHKGQASESWMEIQLAQLAIATAQKLGWQIHPTPTDFTVLKDYWETGYGVVSDHDREAVLLTVQTEGILLNPVYSGRAMAGLIDLIRKGQFHQGQTVLFWHTGGIPALFNSAHS